MTYTGVKAMSLLRHISAMHPVVQCVTNPVHKAMKSKHDNTYVRTVGSRNIFFLFKFLIG